MQASSNPLRGKSLALAFLAAALCSTACQDLNTFVTGENFTPAPKGSPRVEIELIVETSESFFDQLEDAPKLDDEFAEMVLGMADLGTRFYPVPSDEYKSKSERPQYVLIVQIESLAVNTDNKLIEEQGQEPRIESSVKSLDCVAKASVRKRRSEGPMLLVGDSDGTGRVWIRRDPATWNPEGAFEVKPTAESRQPLHVTQSEVVEVVDEAVVDALRGVLKRVDRDLSLGDSAQQR